MRAVNTIRLALSPEIKHNVLKETTQKALWEKLENIYASKSLTNHLCLNMELYLLKMEMGGDLDDHINKKFSRLVSQLLNVDDKLFDEEQTLLLFAHYLGPSNLWFKYCLWEDQLWIWMRWSPLLEKIREWWELKMLMMNIMQ